MYTNLSREELSALKTRLEAEYEALKSKGLALDMSRGKPSREQLDLANEMLAVDLGDYKSECGFDCRNYGLLDGIDEAKRLMSPLLGTGDLSRIIVGGNSSLQLMYNFIANAVNFGVSDEFEPWGKQKTVKFLCPVPGYDRHFTLLQTFGIEMISVPMLQGGPDMNAVEALAAEDAAVKGIFCVPLYSNPDGICCSAETVRRLAAMKTKAADFRIVWDNAYGAHHLSAEPCNLLNLQDECEKAGNPHRAYVFASTSKITFAGGGISAMASSAENIAYTKKLLSVQTIGFDKINQLRHVKFFKDYSGITAHMERHAALLSPKFRVVCDMLENEILPHGLGEWHKPDGGYFVSFNGINGTAKRVVELCKAAGVVLTAAGAAFPYGIDPCDKNIRIAPSFPPVDELQSAMEVFCTSVKLAAVEKMLAT
ncbi:MAG: aminotransferase class I/II-fold pyridoxal phosphate-dependent enzyme [Oscillospiraceae bacterium]|nr:aminotransferase class I/II-fold pyridoxal phosphate-dependent enzyme [Oscillospiraceae bacterium]